MATAAVARDRLSVAISHDRNVRAIEARAANVITAKETELAQRNEQLRVLARAHEVTRPSRSRKLARDWGSGNAIAGMDARQLRDQARHLERDLDLADNALNVLVQNTVGSGIDVLSAPRLPGQPINRDLALQLDELWDVWWDAPEVNRAHDYGACQQLLARSWLRDGEAFYQDLSGGVPYLEHGGGEPYSIEMLEADLVPLDFNDPARNILQGVERNAWGRPVAYHVYKQHPGDPLGWTTETKRVSAEVMHCIANLKRLHQVRGLSVFASAMSRFEDVKDYEESERIAAKVAASMTFQIKKGSGEIYQPAGEGLGGVALMQQGMPVRELRMAPGAIFDDLLPGESIESLGTDRPNPNAATWRKEQLRAAAGGIGVSYSSLSLDYNGTYSAQRQELVKKWGSYLMLAERFIALFVRPTRQRFIEAAVLSGKVRMPRGWTLRHLATSTYVRPIMPWIDPLKEAYAKGEAEDRGWVSPQQNTLQYGNNPDEVLPQRQDWQQQQQQLQPAAPAPAEARAQLRAELSRETSTALTSVRSQFGGGINIIPNAGFESDTSGWSLAVDQWTSGAGIAMRNVGGNGQHPPYLNSFGWSDPRNVFGIYMWNTAPFAAKANKRYMLSTYVAANRAYGVFARVVFLDVNGNEIGNGGQTTELPYDPGGGAGRLIENWRRPFVAVTSPSGTVAARIQLWSGQGSNPYVFWLMPMLEEAGAAQTEPSKWQPSASGIDAKYAQVSQSMSTRITSVENGVANYEASYTWALDVNNRVIGTRSVNNGTIGKITFSADVVEIIGATPGGGRNEFVGGKFYAYAPNGRRVVALGYGVT